MNDKKIEIENCELCVIGIGVSGINALNSSAQYLSKKDKVIVVDRREQKNAVGGMWNTTYDFVRLHQPHPLFTMGNKKWKLGKNPSYLANKNEVIEHFKQCYNSLKNKLLIVEKFGYEYQSYKEVKIENGYEAHISFKSINKDLPDLTIKAKRCIKAFGFNIMPQKPMNFSTEKVHSISPESLSLVNTKMANDDKPIYIIGGGKTSMDVANLILAQNPDRKLNFIIGKGTFFLNRDIFFPAGLKKNWKGTTINKLLIEVALQYDEHNLDSAIENIKDNYGLVPFKKAKHNLFGILSPQELAVVKKSTNAEIYDYLEDVKEEEEEIFIHFKSGQRQKVDQGSWFINCIGHLYKKPEVFEPILSPHETVLSIQTASAAVVFSSLGGYFLPHMWFRNQFKNVPINQFNHLDLLKKDKEAFLFAVSAQVIHNLIYFIEALPFIVVYNCGLNFDKWFPLHRQIPVLLNILVNKKKYLAHTDKLLKHISNKYNVESGVIGQSFQQK